MKFLIYTVCLFSLFISDCNANKLDEKELIIVKSIDQQYPHSLKLLQKVVNINSGTMNFVGVKQIGKIFAKELQVLGFKTKWVEGRSFNRAGHLVASYGVVDNDGAKRKNKILLIGHLDTVFTKDSPFQQFKIIDKKHISGPGITDMKGGDIVMISALRALKKAGVLKNLQIKVFMAGDEEKRGTLYNISTKALIDAGKWADIALGFEDGDGDPKTVVIARRGDTGWRLNVTGRAAHSSLIFRKNYGDGAVFEAARILNSFRTKLLNQPNLTFNPGLILGGTNVNLDPSLVKGNASGKNNVISQTTMVTGDVRALSPSQLANVKIVMQEITAKNLNKTSAQLMFFPGYPPMQPTPGNKQLLNRYNKASIDLGLGTVVAVDPMKAGAADISFIAKYVDMALDGLGSMGKGAHTVKEVADISTLSSQAKRVAVVMYRLSK